METETVIELELYLISFCNGVNTAIANQYKNWLPELYLIAFRYLKNQEEAEDIVADCFEKLMLMPVEKRKQNFLDKQINLKALMIVIVKNKCLDVLKINKNRNRILDGIKDLFPTSSKNLSRKTFSDENFEVMMGCLPEKEQIVLKLNIEGYKNEEISEKLNISEKTVSNLLSMSRSKIRDLWGIFME